MTHPIMIVLILLAATGVGLTAALIVEASARSIPARKTDEQPARPHLRVVK